MRRSLLLTIVVIVTLVLGAEVAARRARSFHKVPAVVPGRAANVVGFNENLMLVPPAPRVGADAPPALLLLGSSQSYASSSVGRNENGIGDEYGSLIDWIASGVEMPSAQYLRFASGSILPNEMMVAEAHVEAMGYRPRVVILPIIWTNIAADREYRPAFREALENADVASRVDRRLVGAGAPDDVLASFRAEAAKAASNASFHGPRPLGDLIDDRLTAWARPRFALVGQRENLQAGFEERVVHQIVGRIAPSTAAERPPNEKNLAYNLAMLRALVKGLLHDDIRVLVYRAPQRTNIPVPVDTSRSDEFVVPLMAELEGMGAVVLDARSAVPDSMFGWSGPSEDYNHFVKDAHRALAQAIVAKGKERGLFAALAR